MTTATPDRLQEWLAAEKAWQARRDAGVGYGPVPPEAFAQFTALEVMRKIIACELPQAPISKTLDFFIAEAEEGRVVFQGTPGPAHLNPMGTIHGGWYATLLDSAMGCAVATSLPRGRAYATAQLNVNLVRAIGPRAPRVRAEAKVLHVGRQMATAEGWLAGPDGTLYAHGTTTCLVFDLK